MRNDGQTTDLYRTGAQARLEVRDLVVDFPLDSNLFNRQYMRAVNGVSFTINAGEALAIVGESGSGKSTCARALTRLYKPTSGVVSLDGIDLNDDSLALSRAGLASQVQMIFQDPFGSLNPVHTAMHHLERPIRIHHPEIDETGVRDKLHANLEKVGLSPPEQFASKFPHEMSGGQRQRLAIARALSTGARFILADEPISMLDVSIRLGILNLMSDMKDRGIGFLYITHDIATARYFAERTAVMYVGHMVEWGESDTVTQSPAHPYTQLLIGSIPEVGRSHNKARVRQTKSGQIPLWKPESVGCPFVERCPRAQKQCSISMPPVTEIQPGHYARCFALD